ncbi:hypothetical protein [Selenomonas ruminantium]|uniref:Uncharacterized protein n=1 Tax=Selenomonas ruminantium TaxID=971 RepID=A0A1I0Y9S0_SELRU|nr:hypothetical protein [Selenomonas ruminantium]SFB10135.1 hypothetical protein SAMN05216587_11136 [Selenomonas ruminantium]
MENNVISTGSWKEYQRIVFYKDKTTATAKDLNSTEFNLPPENWKDQVKTPFDRVFIQNYHGIVIDSNLKIRNARKLNLEKNDVFAYKEGENKSLYIPTDVSLVGTEKKVETRYGYHLYNKYEVLHPVEVEIMGINEISKEESDRLCNEWGRTTHYADGIHYETKYREASFIGNESWLLIQRFTMVLPYFYHLEFNEIIRSDFYKKTDGIADKINGILHRKILSHYDIGELLNHFDITEKQEQ